MAEYWDARRESLYYRAVFQVVSVVGRDAASILDVGSAETDYILWFHWIGRKVQLNTRFRSELEGVERVRANFFDWQPPEPFDVTMCLQVLEHITDAPAFCDRLKAASRRLVISVPYKWHGGTPGHVNDPVDETKLHQWMGLKPNYSMTVEEPFGPRRLIAYYDLVNGPKARIPRAVAKVAIAEKGAAAHRCR